MVESGVISTGVADHDLTFCTRKVSTPPSQGTCLALTRSYRHYDASTCLSDLQETIHSVYDYSSVDGACSQFTSSIKTVLDKHAPWVRKRIHLSPPSWLNNDIKHLMFLRDYHKSRVGGQNGQQHSMQYRSLRNQVTALIRRTKAEDLSQKLISHRGNPQATWKLVHSHIKPPKPGLTCIRLHNTLLVKPTDIADCLNDHFTRLPGPMATDPLQPSPLPAQTPSRSPPPSATTHLRKFSFSEVSLSQVEKALMSVDPRKATGLDTIPPKFLHCAALPLAGPLQHIINLSFKSSKFPSCWTEAKVIPLFKKGDPTDPDNFRPISILPAASKILERLAHQQLLTFLTNQNILYHLQSGFRPLHSTTTGCAILLESIVNHLHTGKFVGVLFIDLCKAFDSVDHNRLLEKLASFLDDSALQWMHSYLRSRSQKVSIKGTLSESRPVNRGVPQGSILGPTLFSLYTNDQHICDEELETFKYADDEADLRASHDLGALINSLDQTILDLQEKLDRDRMCLNTQKTVFMVFSPSSTLRTTAAGVTVLPRSGIKRVNTFTYLGLCITDTMDWGEHISQCQNKIRKRMWMVTHFRDSASTRLLRLLFTSLVQPIMDYGILFYSACRQKDLDTLQRLQNAFAKIILGWGRRASATRARQILDLLPVADRAYLHILLYVYRVTRGQAPPYLQQLFTPASTIHAHNTRERDMNLFLPGPQSSLQKKGLTHRAIVAWNSLPATLKSVPTIHAFKRELMVYIKQKND